MNYLILLSLSLILFGSRLYYVIKKGKFTWRELFIILFLLYLIVFIKMMLLNDKEFTLNLGSMIKQAKFIPSLTFTDGYMQLIKTIFTTIPFGFFISAIRSTNSGYKDLFQYAFFISFTMETLRLFKLNEIWSIDHIFLMMTGFLIGGAIYRLIYKLLKLISKEILLDALKDSHPQPIKKSYKLIFSLIIIYILGVYTCLVYQTYPLSILDNTKIIQIDDFKIEIEDKLTHFNIKGYYETSFNRLKRLYVTKFELEEEIYDVYTLVEPYKPQTETNYAILVVGWIEKPKTIKINYKDKNYAKQLEPGFFAIGYPEIVSEIPILNIHAHPVSNLNITFYDEFDNIVEVPFKKEIIE